MIDKNISSRIIDGALVELTEDLMSWEGDRRLKAAGTHGIVKGWNTWNEEAKVEIGNRNYMIRFRQLEIITSGYDVVIPQERYTVECPCCRTTHTTEKEYTKDQIKANGWKLKDGKILAFCHTCFVSYHVNV